MSYWQLFYHLVWSTKNRQPLLTPLVEKHIYGYLTSKATGLKGVVYTIGGTTDHVHMVVAIPPAISVSKCQTTIRNGHRRQLEMPMPRG